MTSFPAPSTKPLRLRAGIFTAFALLTASGCQGRKAPNWDQSGIAGTSRLSSAAPNSSMPSMDTNTMGIPSAGIDSSSVPAIPTLSKVFAGGSTSCGLYSDGTLRCFGQNNLGQLGLGHKDAIGDQPQEMGAALRSPEFPAGTRFEDVVLGQSSCAKTTQGQMYCWGHNQYGQLGAGHSDDVGDDPGEMGKLLLTVPVGSDSTVTDHCVGQGHSCARLADGRVKCWGRNDHGQLGLGHTDSVGAFGNQMGDLLPAVNLGHHPEHNTPRRALQVACGQFHTCVLTLDYDVLCWGRNDKGQLGQGHSRSVGGKPKDMGNNLAAVTFVNQANKVDLVAGYDHTCVRSESGKVHCWGANDQGQLGLGDTTHVGTQAQDAERLRLGVRLGSDLPVEQVVAGRSHTCARLADGSVRCWGSNRLGALGLGRSDVIGDQDQEMGAALTPVALGAGFAASDLVAGESHNCAQNAAGEVRCWGHNDSGQLGVEDALSRGLTPEDMGDALVPAKLNLK